MNLHDVASRLPAEKIEFLRSALLEWGPTNFAEFPWRYTRDPFHALIAEMLLQRTRAEQVVATYKRFVTEFPDASSLATAKDSLVRDVIGHLGLHWRAEQLILLARYLDANGQYISDDSQTLRQYPGVGPYVAASFLSLHRGIRACIVDSNVVRLYGRLFGFPTNPETRRRKALLQLADILTPLNDHRSFNYALIDLTRQICRPRPQCCVCPLAASCESCNLSGRP